MGGDSEGSFRSGQDAVIPASLGEPTPPQRRRCPLYVRGRQPGPWLDL